ncbi:MAG TPA: hypothetical protein VMS75_03185 [Terriglobales bacterium]|nr:hypothetical protein [Terriglobales bacterium]
MKNRERKPPHVVFRSQNARIAAVLGFSLILALFFGLVFGIVAGPVAGIIAGLAAGAVASVIFFGLSAGP